jgi:hypothetical protein
LLVGERRPVGPRQNQVDDLALLDSIGNGPAAGVTAVRGAGRDSRQPGNRDDVALGRFGRRATRGRGLVTSESRYCTRCGIRVTLPSVEIFEDVDVEDLFGAVRSRH